MKSIYLLVVVLIILGILWILKIDSKDRKARKEAEKVTALVTVLQCKQRLKGDKSLMKLEYNKKEYAIFFENEKDCSQYQMNQKVEVYYSETYDKLFVSI